MQVYNVIICQGWCKVKRPKGKGDFSAQKIGAGERLLTFPRQDGEKRSGQGQGSRPALGREGVVCAGRLSAVLKAAAFGRGKRRPGGARRVL